jgi:hypothetical protein
MTSRRCLGSTAAVAAIVLGGEPANAQAGGERLLGEASAEGPANCPVVTLRFTVPVRFNGTASTEPSVTRLRIEPATSGNFAARDLLSVPAGVKLIGSVSWERDAPGGAMLIVTFTAPTRAEVGLGNDSQSIVLDLENRTSSSGCGKPLAPSVAPPALPPAVLDPAELAKLQNKAEGALLRKDNAAAAVALDRILAARDNDYTPRAIELRGLVHERLGEPVEARERYNEYMRRYPGDAGAVRVLQRIAGLPSAPAASLGGGKAAEVEGRWRQSISGSFSQFYSRDESRNRFLDARRADPQEEIDRRINIDQLLSTLDVSASATNGRTRLSARASASYTNDFRPVTLVGSTRSDGDDTARIYQLYVDARDEPSGLSGRIGRQSLFGSGVFGRFDGIRLGWQANPGIEVHAQAGFPIASPRTDRVIRDRWFYGLSVGYAPPDSSYGLTAYWYDQRSHGLADRRAIGVEGRYTTKGIALFGLVDVDVLFGKLSHFFLSATVPMAGGASLSVQADQQYYPPLTLTNAVIGQPRPRLEELKRQFDRSTLRRLAEDRSARSRSLTMTYTKPLSERWTAQLDLTLASLGRTPASAGVEAIPGSGTEFYGGGQLVGSGIFTAGDTLTGGLRYASTERFHIVDGELAARVPFGTKLAIEPRLRVARRTDKFGPGHQTAWRPNLRATYQATRWIAFDAEIGMVYFRQRQDDAAFAGKNRERATLLNLGYRLTF